jgi:hypothetical protein
MKGTEMNLFSHLPKFRLVLKVLLQVLNGLFDPLVIDFVVFGCQDHKSIIYDSKLLLFTKNLNPDLAEMEGHYL